MADNNTVIVNKEKQGFLKKIGNSIASIPAGIIILIMGILILAGNEKTNVNNIKDVKELRGQINDISSEKVDSSYDGKLVALSGKLVYGETPVVDTVFNVKASTPKMVRVVEMYQWVEEKNETDDKVTYTYSKEWSDELIDSSEFKSPSGHENSGVMPYEKESYVVEDELKVGAFTLINSFKDQLSTSKEYKDFTDATLPEGYTVNNKYITNSADYNNPQVGDVRISYLINDYKDVSVLGKQNNNTIEKYTSKNNQTYARLYEGTKNGTDMINSIEAGNKFIKWFKRALGTLLIIIGIGLILGPITTLIGYIPFLGNIVNSMIGVVSFLIGLAISLLVIAISWFVVRPVLSIILIAVIVGIIVGILYLKKTKAVTPKTVEEK